MHAEAGDTSTAELEPDRTGIMQEPKAEQGGVQLSDIVDVDFIVVAEVESNITVFFTTHVGLVDLGILGQLPICLHCKHERPQ